MAQTSTRVAFDANEHTLNRNKWTYEELLPYLGHWVAWSLDGKSIIAHHEDPMEVVRACRELGLTGEDFVMGGLPSKEELDGWL